MCWLFFLQVTIDASNSFGLASRKDAEMPTKSSSSVELGPLYWQLEVGAVVTCEIECSGKENQQDVDGFRKNKTCSLFWQMSAMDFSLIFSSNPEWKIQPSFSSAGEQRWELAWDGKWLLLCLPARRQRFPGSHM